MDLTRLAELVAREDERRHPSHQKYVTSALDALRREIAAVVPQVVDQVTVPVPSYQATLSMQPHVLCAIAAMKETNLDALIN